VRVQGIVNRWPAYHRCLVSFHTICDGVRPTSASAAFDGVSLPKPRKSPRWRRQMSLSPAHHCEVGIVHTQGVSPKLVSGSKPCLFGARSGAACPWSAWQVTGSRRSARPGSSAWAFSRSRSRPSRSRSTLKGRDAEDYALARRGDECLSSTHHPAPRLRPLHPTVAAYARRRGDRIGASLAAAHSRFCGGHLAASPSARSVELWVHADFPPAYY
jgi:hypothetical protein